MVLVVCRKKVTAQKGSSQANHLYLFFLRDSKAFQVFNWIGIVYLVLGDIVYLLDCICKSTDPSLSS